MPLLVPRPAVVVKGLAHGDRLVLGASVHTNPGPHLSQHQFLHGLRQTVTIWGSRAGPVGVRASQTGLTLYPKASPGRVSRFVTTHHLVLPGWQVCLHLHLTLHCLFHSLNFCICHGPEVGVSGGDAEVNRLDLIYTAPSVSFITC